MQKQLRNYEFPPRVWLLKESNRSPLDTQLFALFLLLRFILTEREKKNSHRRRHQCHRRPNRAHRSLENYNQQHANGEKKKKKVIWQFLWSFFVCFCLLLLILASYIYWLLGLDTCPFGFGCSIQMSLSFVCVSTKL